MPKTTSGLMMIEILSNLVESFGSATKRSVQRFVRSVIEKNASVKSVLV